MPHKQLDPATTLSMQCLSLRHFRFECIIAPERQAEHIDAQVNRVY
jgi:hypothetical protein